MRKLLRPDYILIAAATLSLPLLAGCSTGRWNVVRAPISKNAASHETAASSAPQTGSAQVVVVHGTVGYWPGCDDFVANLAVRGAPATTIRGWEVNRTADKIADARRSGGSSGPLVLVGYGRGANDALRLARRLQQSDIVVNKVVLLETASNDSVPANVESCLNVYQSSAAEDWLPAFRGLPVTVESAGTQLVNYNLKYHDEGVARADLNHFTVCKNYTVLGMVTEHVTAALRQDDSPGGLHSVAPGSTTGEPVSQVASSRSSVDERFLPFE
jgi:pimeloyl-ACP methyl ester carboxylesterase